MGERIFCNNGFQCCEDCMNEDTEVCDFCDDGEEFESADEQELEAA